MVFLKSCPRDKPSTLSAELLAALPGVPVAYQDPETGK